MLALRQAANVGLGFLLEINALIVLDYWGFQAESGGAGICVHFSGQSQLDGGLAGVRPGGGYAFAHCRR
jgi:hypothetical protein